MKRAVTVLTTLMVFLIATGSAAADWRDAGIPEEKRMRSVHVFEYVIDDGTVTQRIFVPEQVELGGILAVKILYLKAANGQDRPFVWKLSVVGIASNGVELSLLSGRVDRYMWDQTQKESIKDKPLLHLWLLSIEQENEKRDVRLSYSVDEGTIRLLVSGFQEVMIAVHPQDSSYLTTEAWLLQ